MIVRDAVWQECSMPLGDLLLIHKNERTMTAIYQSLRTAHIYRLFMLENKWEFAS